MGPLDLVNLSTPTTQAPVKGMNQRSLVDHTLKSRHTFVRHIMVLADAVVSRPVGLAKIVNGDAYRWIKSSGPTRLVLHNQEIGLSATAMDEGDVRIHTHPGGQQLWVLRAAEAPSMKLSWVEARIGDHHPKHGMLYFLNIKNDGTPSWVKLNTAQKYQRQRASSAKPKVEVEVGEPTGEGSRARTRTRAAAHAQAGNSRDDKT